jgi:hypothetical protein
VLRRHVFRGLVLAPVLLLGGCQACVADSSAPQDTAQSHPAPGPSLSRFRPRPMLPSSQRLFLRDAGVGDQ